MPCNAIVYLPATVKQADTTLIFADPEIKHLFANMLNATLNVALNHRLTEDYTYVYDDNITAWLPQGVLRIWQNGTISVRLYDYTPNPEQVTAALDQAVADTLSALTQFFITQAIGAIAPIQDTQLVGKNLVLTVNL